MKTKTQILYPKKTSFQYETEDIWPYEDYEYYQEWCDDEYDSYDHYYWEYQNDTIRLREDKIDNILGLNKTPSLGDLMPDELISKK